MKLRIGSAYPKAGCTRMPTTWAPIIWESISDSARAASWKDSMPALSEAPSLIHQPNDHPQLQQSTPLQKCVEQLRNKNNLTSFDKELQTIYPSCTGSPSNRTSEAQQMVSNRLTPNELSVYAGLLAKSRSEPVAEMIRMEVDLCIRTRGKGGSRKKGAGNR